MIELRCDVRCIHSMIDTVWSIHPSIDQSFHPLLTYIHIHRHQRPLTTILIHSSTVSSIDHIITINANYIHTCSSLSTHSFTHQLTHSPYHQSIERWFHWILDITQKYWRWSLYVLLNSTLLGNAVVQSSVDKRVKRIGRGIGWWYVLASCY